MNSAGVRSETAVADECILECQKALFSFTFNFRPDSISFASAMR